MCHSKRISVFTMEGEAATEPWKRQKVALEAPNKATAVRVHAFDESNVAGFKPPLSREEEFDRWLATQPIPWNRDPTLELATAPAAVAGSAAAAPEGKQAAGGVNHEDYANAMVHLREAAGEMSKLWKVLDMRSKGEMRTVPLGLPEDEPAAPTAAELRQVCTLP